MGPRDGAGEMVCTWAVRAEASMAPGALDARALADNMSSRAPSGALSESNSQSGRAILNVRHLTTYRYARPVEFGDHRMMMRPRDGHDQRLLSSELDIDPEPRRLRWLYDTFDNCVAIASFSGAWTSLRVENRFAVERIVDESPGGEIDSRAEFYPFFYAPEELPGHRSGNGAPIQRSSRGSSTAGCANSCRRGATISDQPSLDDDDLRDQRRVLYERREALGSRRRSRPWSDAAAPAATSRS